MQTTRKQALKIYNIVKWINSYEVCDLDKEEHINALMSFDLEENINQLDDYIYKSYDDTRDLLNDTTLLRKYLNLKKEIDRQCK